MRGTGYIGGVYVHKRSLHTHGGSMELLTLGIVAFLGYVVGVFLIIRTAGMIRRNEEMLFGKE
jgi:hypothetical protein